MRQLSYAQICQLYSECHGPSGTVDTHAMQWAIRMERMIGPDNCKGFVIRGRVHLISGLYLMNDQGNWCGVPCNAKLFTWGETAVKITNNPKLEAIRVDHDNMVKDCRGRTISWYGR